MPNLDLNNLEKEIGKKIEVLSRGHLENEGGKKLLRAATKERVAFLVPGDPLIATTHISLRLSAGKIGVRARGTQPASLRASVCQPPGPPRSQRSQAHPSTSRPAASTHAR